MQKPRYRRQYSCVTAITMIGFAMTSYMNLYTRYSSLNWQSDFNHILLIVSMSICTVHRFRSERLDNFKQIDGSVQ